MSGHINMTVLLLTLEHSEKHPFGGNIMSGPEFFQTAMGRKFFQSDVPKMLTLMERIAKALENLVGELEEEDET
jgi:hypothetical protein